jgi:vacuolar-type H+-ATPase catalytic subunit A/Vma1
LSLQGYKAEEVAAWAKAWTEIKDSIVGYIGEILKDPEMFPQPARFISHSS